MDVVVAPDTGGPDATPIASQTVGAAGGAVTGADVSLTIPVGALASNVAITLSTGGAELPAGYAGLSPVFSFSPAGTTFAKPATIVITLSEPAAGTTIFWSNAAGGYDALATTVTGLSASASITHLGQCFAGYLAEGMDATTANEAGSRDGGVEDAGAGRDGAAEDATTGADSGGSPLTTADGGVGDASTPDGPVEDAATAADGGVTDGAAAADDGASANGAPAISVSIDGVPTDFIYNVRSSLIQSFWTITGDDSPSPSHWTLQLVVPANAETLTCQQGGTYPSIAYTHYSTDAGTADAMFTLGVNTGSNCTIDETTTATVQGEQAQGTFSGTLTQSVDGGGFSHHTFASGSYDVAVQ